MPKGKADRPLTRADLESLKSDLQVSVRTGLKDEIASVRTELKDGIASVRTELKEEIASVRTELKEEIASVRTELKEEIASVRTELKGDIQRVAVELVKTQARVEHLGQSLREEIAAGNDRVMTAIDGLAKLVRADNRAMVIHGQMLTEHGDKLADHEKRLSAVETKP